MSEMPAIPILSGKDLQQQHDYLNREAEVLLFKKIMFLEDKNKQ